MKLYELTGEIAEVMAMVEAGELTQEEAADTLEGLNIATRDKLINLAKYMLSIGPMIEGVDSEVERLQKRKKHLKGQKAWAEEYLDANMKKAGTKGIECDLLVIKRRKRTKVAVIDDEHLVPDRYLIDVPATKKVDKKGLLRDLKEGEQIAGAHLEDGKASIFIK